MSRCIVDGCTTPPTHTIPFTYQPDPDQPTTYTWTGHVCANHKDLTPDHGYDLTFDQHSLAEPLVRAASSEEGR